MSKWLCFLFGGLALVACAHRGGEIFLSPTLDFREAESYGTIGRPVAALTTPFPTEVRPTGAAVIEPNPAVLGIRSVPTQHHPVDFVSRRSAVITASPGGIPIVVHNNGQLLGKDACSEAALAPEGDTRLTIILPESQTESRSRFYLVGCAPGPATLTIVSEGDLLNVYHWTVLAP